jgi:hypothetical protein
MTSIWKTGLMALAPDIRSLILREETESHDREAIEAIVEKYFENTYPEFMPEVVSTMEKDYFLPALKVLERRKDGLYSPHYSERWDDMELKATCRRVLSKDITYQIGGMIRAAYGMPDNTDEVTQSQHHRSPDDECDCGIYGSVNLEELKVWMEPEKEDDSWMMGFNPAIYPGNEEFSEKHEKVLCIIEPSEDAKIILCRKGWRASSAFVSEIVNETIGMSAASQLLSMAWHRLIQVGRIYENRKKD